MWCLTHSRGLILSLRHYQLRHRTPDNSWSDAVISQSHRWGEVEVLFETTPAGLFPAFGLPTPNLTRPSLHNESWVPAGIELHESGLPLTYLDLCNCPIPWGSRRLLGGGLTVLELTRSHSTDGPSLGQLHNILASSPALQTISFTCLSGTRRWGPVLGDCNLTLKFAELRELVLAGLDTSL